MNGDLLAALEGVCDFFVTGDRNLLHQQPSKVRGFGIAVVISPSNRLHDLKPLIEKSLSLFNQSGVNKIFQIE